MDPRRWGQAFFTLLKTFGFRGLALRAVHELRRLTGRFRRRPLRSLQRVGGESRAAFRVDPAELRRSIAAEAMTTRLANVLAGRHHAFRSEWRAIPGSAEEWLTHPVTGEGAAAGSPWWKTRHSDPDFGDIKALWEPARFGWAYDLARGWLATGDDRCAARFHEHLESWLASSPPFSGPHWSCGQETSIRAAALLYAEANLADAPSSTPAAMERLETVLAASGERIADALGYAISQRNNHGLSEAAGLIMLGARFRGQHPEAQRWLERGQRWLERLIREQFAEDGWYIQHSFTYLRLALDVCVLAERALRGVGRRLSSGAVARLRAAVDLLLAVIEPETGIVPNHGANDGALVHPITLAQYRDFRPVITAVCALWGHPIPAEIAVDREVLAWLGLDAPPEGAPLRDGIQSGESGWLALRRGGTHIFLWAGRYASRPSHMDSLHVDVRLDGSEVVVDPGTFSYNAPPPWRDGLAAAWVHNGPIANGRDPGLRGPRFLWLRWPEAGLESTRWGQDVAEIVARVPGSHRRTVRVQAGRVVIEDEPLSTEVRELEVSWLLHPDADPGQVQITGPSRMVEAREGDTRGWFSPRYGERIPSRSVIAVRKGPVDDMSIVTEILRAPGAAEARTGAGGSSDTSSEPEGARER